MRGYEGSGFRGEKRPTKGVAHLWGVQLRGKTRGGAGQDGLDLQPYLAYLDILLLVVSEYMCDSHTDRLSTCKALALRFPAMGSTAALSACGRKRNNQTRDDDEDEIMVCWAFCDSWHELRFKVLVFAFLPVQRTQIAPACPDRHR